MRPLAFLAPFLLAAATSGCVAPGPYQQGYAQPGYAVQTQVGEPTFYDDRPAVLYGGQPTYIIEDPALGWGWRGPDRSWHNAPNGWRGPGDWDRRRPQNYRQPSPPPAYRQEQRGGYRPEQQNYGRQQEQRQPERQQGRPVQQQQPQQQRPQPQQRPPQPQRQENQRRTCPAGQLIC